MVIILLLYIFIYFIFFQIKSLRDYLMERKSGYGHRWDDSIWKNKLPNWLQGYLINDPELFIYSNPPKLMVKILWKRKRYGFKQAVDGWHQADGVIFMLPHGFIVLLIGLMFSLSWYWIMLGMVVVPFIIWYTCFNLNYYVFHRKFNKEWKRLPKWVRWFFRKK